MEKDTWDFMRDIDAEGSVMPLNPPFVYHLGAQYMDCVGRGRDYCHVCGWVNE